MKKRARELGIQFPGTTGKYNAITDVEGIEVGYCTLMIGEPEDSLRPGAAFARTGVTAILPQGKKKSILFAGRHDLNGNGELTGTHWVDDSGFLHGPIMLTNTHSVGVVRDATSQWMVRNKLFQPLLIDGQEIEDCGFFYPVVGETWDGILNDINGFHVTKEHAWEAIENAKSGAIQEGNVGGGTGMRCHLFKGGTGTSSRVLSREEGGYTVGVLVQANHGRRDFFQLQGVPLGMEITGCAPINNFMLAPKPGSGSIVVVVATDAPLLPHQLSKLCKRVPIGIGRLGGGFENGSGDIFVAFSTANKDAFSASVSNISMLSDEMIDPLYKAVADSVEEAIFNALCAAETLVGRAGNTCYALPQDQVVDIMKKYGRL